MSRSMKLASLLPYGRSDYRRADDASLWTLSPATLMGSGKVESWPNWPSGEKAE